METLLHAPAAMGVDQAVINSVSDRPREACIIHAHEVCRGGPLRRFRALAIFLPNRLVVFQSPELIRIHASHVTQVGRGKVT